MTIKLREKAEGEYIKALLLEELSTTSKTLKRGIAQRIGLHVQNLQNITVDILSTNMGIQANGIAIITKGAIINRLPIKKREVQQRMRKD